MSRSRPGVAAAPGLVMPTEPSAPDLSGRREQIVRILRAADGPRGIAGIAAELDVHPNTVRFHLDALERAGRVERVLGAGSGPGRPPILYRARHVMDPGGPTNYRLLATMLTGQLAARRTAGEAATALGRRWGARLVDAPARQPARVSRGAALARVGAMMAELGFAPEPSRAGQRAREIRLRHCPFLGLIGEHAAVICPLHLGLMQGAFEALSGPVTVDRLDAFVEPDLCVARLAPITGSAGTKTPCGP